MIPNVTSDTEFASKLRNNKRIIISCLLLTTVSSMAEVNDLVYIAGQQLPPTSFSTCETSSLSGLSNFFGKDWVQTKRDLNEYKTYSSQINQKQTTTVLFKDEKQA